MNIKVNLEKYYQKQSEIYRLSCIQSLLHWDQQINMPPKAAEARAEQLEYLSSLIHSKRTDEELYTIVSSLYDELNSLSIPDQVNIRESKRMLDRERKLPEDFVAEMSKAEALGYSAWKQARPADDWQAIKPHLEHLFDLVKRQSEFIGYKKQPYDAMLDIYDPGSTTALVKPLLTELAEELRQLIPQITTKFENISELNGDYPLDTQKKLSRKVLEILGFDFKSQRIDMTAHPFMTSLGPHDFRISTRYYENDFMPGLYSTIHEAGHAIYEMGLPPEYAGTPMGEAVSLSIHESQSRLFENIIGRSREFCGYLSPILAEYFPQDPIVKDPDNYWMHANFVCPTLIRTEADEVTYSQHIVIRMLLEEAILDGDLTVEELPGAWNDLYEKYLGVRPKDYKDGVMQDVHWYTGAVGYFPTYALGNLYNSMMRKVILADIPNLSQQIAEGDVSQLKVWLQDKVYQYGMRYHSPKLIKLITGKELSATPFVDYLKQKFLES